MFIPEWILWVVSILAVVAAMNFFDQGDWDFITPLIAVGVILIAAALRAGIWIGG